MDGSRPARRRRERILIFAIGVILLGAIVSFWWPAVDRLSGLSFSSYARYALLVLALVWSAAWVFVGGDTLKRETRRRRRNVVLVTLGSFVAAVFIVALHWIQVAVAEHRPDPMEFVLWLLALEFVCFVVLATAGTMTRAVESLWLNFTVFIALMLATYCAWGRYVAEV